MKREDNETFVFIIYWKINKFGSDYSFEEGKYGDTILFMNEKTNRVLE